MPLFLQNTLQMSDIGNGAIFQTGQLSMPTGQE